jgi:alkanesulfonate monooxygenase SsuD/methylene tetrahydromethanopterin reductase-like flavin-dependent oxidoreductase (luciferase family)
MAGAIDEGGTDMEIGIGLPGAISGVDGRTLIEWARNAEQRGFSTLGIIDRLVYDNYEPLATLAAAGAVTDRIRLTTSILLGPLRTNHALFAKQAATIDRLSGGRLVLGIAVGGREDDFTESRIDFHQRGRDLEALLRRATSIWRNGVAGIGPATTRGHPTVIIGGNSPASLRRMATYGAGWIAGGGGTDAFRDGASAAREAWADAGREGSPRLLSLAYFSLGHDAGAKADRYLKHYYAFAGPYAERVAAGALRTPAAVRERISEMADAGCDELILFPCSSELDQVELLADVSLKAL